MKTVIICGEDEDVPSEEQLKTFGYKITRQLYIPYEECDLQDLTAHFSLQRELHPFENSLRASWIDVLTRFTDDPDPILFGECDMCPRVHAEVLTDYTQKHMSKTVDVFRCHLWLEHGYPDRVHSVLGSVPFDQVLKMDSRTLQSRFPSCVHPNQIWKIRCGTHAMVVPQRARKALAAVFRNYALPVDEALAYAALTGELSVVCPVQNLFVQDLDHKSSNPNAK